MRNPKQFASAIVIAMLKVIPSGVFERIAYLLISARARGLSSGEALRMLFRLDQRLYSLHGEQAIRYGEGLHPKHRLMRYHDFFIEHVRSGDRVLDIGCGIGAVAFDVASSTGAAVTGIDKNSEKIAEAKKRYQLPNLTFILGDALTVLPSESVDVVILSNLLEHVEDRVSFLKEVTSKLSPRQYLIRVPSFERDWRVALKQELNVDYHLDSTHWIEHRVEELHRELQDAGLSILSSQTKWGEVWVVCEPRAQMIANQEAQMIVDKETAV